MLTGSCSRWCCFALVALALAVRPVLARLPGCGAPPWRCSGGPPRPRRSRRRPRRCSSAPRACQTPRSTPASQRLALIKAKRG